MQHNILNARYRSCCYQSLVSFLIFVEFILTCLRCDFPLPAYVLYPPFPLYISPSVFKSVFFPSSLSVRIVLRLSVCSPWPSFISLHFHIPLQFSWILLVVVSFCQLPFCCMHFGFFDFRDLNLHDQIFCFCFLTCLLVESAFGYLACLPICNKAATGERVLLPMIVRFNRHKTKQVPVMTAFPLFLCSQPLDNKSDLRLQRIKMSYIISIRAVLKS